MDKTRKRVLLLILLLALAYFAVFILPNQTGAADATMLSAFEHDEFAQYPNLMQMFRGGETPLLAFKHFLTYQHYYYGFPFYLFSALVLFPVKWILGPDWMTHTRTIMTVLRQLISVLPVLLSAFLLVLDQLRSKAPWKALLTFLLLICLPAVVGNNMWWHPDGLLTLFCTLTVLLLIRDEGKLGLYFYLSGVACALAIGAKFLGALFVLTYIAYLLYAKIARKQTWKKVILSAGAFLVVMLGSVVITNPLLLLPIERGEIIAAVSIIFSESAQGFYVAGGGFLTKLKDVALVLRSSYGGVLLFLMALANLVLCLVKRRNVLKSLVVLTWVTALIGYFLFYASTLRGHYFIPAVLPLYACLLDLVPAREEIKRDRKALFNQLAGIAVVLMTIVVIGLNTSKAVNSIREIAQREENSASLAMFRAFEEDVLPRLPEGTPLVIYRDWRAYVADNAHWQVIYNWDLASYTYVEENQPDLLVIEQENALYFADDAKLSLALDQDVMRDMNAFYSDVLSDTVRGFHEVYHDSFGYVFASDALFEKYFQ